ncbi:MAG: class I SAM-dependent methyltransferase, partial [Chloroflexi bacterium]|nr:class I SAM-dependent methyltransferase [Chloroflexota bacterium]
MVDTFLRADQATLIKQAYATDEHLATRIRIHEIYSEPKIDFQKWVVDSMQWRGDEWVLDVGAGPGTYFSLVAQRIPRGRLFAGDLSMGMLRQAQQHPQVDQIQLLNLDAQRLPFADGMFDAVLANHMLYHVPDVEKAIKEIKRILKPNGCLIAATNSADTMPEIDTLMRRACTLLGYPKQDVTPAHSAFALENGTVLVARNFRAVARYDIPSALRFPEVAPVMDYLNSTQALRSPQLPPGIGWDEFMGVMEKQITRLIRHFGELQVQKLAGVLIGTNGGGFAEDYLQKL